MLYIIIALVVIVLVLIITNIRIVPQSNAFVIERLGAYQATWNVGLHVKMPFIDRIVTLSRVITGCGGKSKTFSLSETFFTMRSINGIFT